MEKKYLIYMLGSTLMWLLSIIILNYIIDPGALYHRQRNFSVADFAKSISHSKYGLWWPEGSFNEREIKKELIAHSKSDCAVIGSSHVMQIGNTHNNVFLRNTCKSILNLGVSGASIEDHFIYAYLAIKNKHIKKIILGIDPWTFAYNKDMRYDILHKQYELAKSTILKCSVARESNAQSAKYLNLINFEYTKRSLQTLRNSKKTKEKTFHYTISIPVDRIEGGEYPLFLPDGSLIYSAKYISDCRKNNKKISDATYKTDGELNQGKAISNYKKLLLWIKRNHIEPILMMTPYHEISWKNKQTMNYRAFNKTNKVITRLAHELDIKIIGTYQPFLATCSDTEFYDFMHPTLDCVNKLSLTYQGNV